MKNCVVVLFCFFLSLSNVFSGDIDNYRCFGLTWESTISNFHEKFPKARQINADSDRGTGVQHWMLSSIGDVDRAVIAFHNGQLFQFVLVYSDRIQPSWKTLLTRLKDEFGEPDPGYEERNRKLIYRWSFPSSDKVIYLIPNAETHYADDSSYTKIEIRDNLVWSSISKTKAAEGF